ncbi:hypothetical protein D3C73_1429160 [compost metagenome]
MTTKKRSADNNLRNTINLLNTTSSNSTTNSSKITRLNNTTKLHSQGLNNRAADLLRVSFKG